MPYRVPKNSSVSASASSIFDTTPNCGSPVGYSIRGQIPVGCSQFTPRSTSIQIPSPRFTGGNASSPPDDSPSCRRYAPLAVSRLYAARNDVPMPSARYESGESSGPNQPTRLKPARSRTIPPAGVAERVQSTASSPPIRTRSPMPGDSSASELSAIGAFGDAISHLPASASHAYTASAAGSASNSSSTGAVSAVQPTRLSPG